MKRLFRKIVFALNAVLLSVLVPVCAADAPATAKPNVLVILADDLGFSDFGCYGGEIATPQVDRLAAEGLRFTQFYNTGRCWPTRAALLTGYYAQQVRRDNLPNLPLQHGVRGVRPNWAPLLPELLRPLGYRSYLSGKWHVDGLPLKNGFDRAYDLSDHDRFFYPKTHTEDDRKLPPATPDDGYYATTAIADHAIKCLKEHASKHPGQPFFHYLCFTAPHFPLHALPEDIERYRDKYRHGWNAVQEERWQRLKSLGIVNSPLPPMEEEIGPPYHFPQALTQLGAGEINRPLPWSSLTEEQREFQAAKMAIHAAMIDRMDREIGRVIDQLKAMNAFENTLILVLSDNGASAEIMVRGDGHNPAAPPGSGESYLCLGPGWSSAANSPFRRHKTWVHEGGIATPLIAHWPKGISARGELRHAPGHVIDFVPTLFELAGIPLPDRWRDEPVPAKPGRSLVPFFAKDDPVTPAELWWFHEGHRAIRVGDWKLVAAANAPWELYNLATDRAELNDLASSEPARFRELERLWNLRVKEFRALATKDLPAAPAKN
jgi:arylsulfatase A-like enzyme